MTFLKALGVALVKGLQIWSGFAPAIQAAIPGSEKIVQTISQDLTEIGTIVVQVETFGSALGLTGVDKLHAAAPSVANIIAQSALLAGKPIQNPTLYYQGVTKMTDGMADILNSVHPSAVETTPVPQQPDATPSA